MVQILYVRVQPGGGTDADITDVRWYNPQSGDANVATVPAMIQFINDGGRAYICDGSAIRELAVVSLETHAYLRLAIQPSSASLLYLPRF